MTQPSATATASSSGIGLFGLTFVVLLVLKLTGIVHISWWWVFAPLLAGVAWTIFWLVILLIVVLIVDKK